MIASENLLDLSQATTMHASAEVYQPLLDYFSEQQIAELTFAIALMNLFNRLGVGLRKPLPNPNARAWPEEQAFVV